MRVSGKKLKIGQPPFNVDAQSTVRTFSGLKYCEHAIVSTRYGIEHRGFMGLLQFKGKRRFGDVISNPQRGRSGSIMAH